MTAPTFEELTPDEREQIQALWVRQYLARLRAVTGGGRRKGDRRAPVHEPPPADQRY